MRVWMLSDFTLACPGVRRLIACTWPSAGHEGSEARPGPVQVPGADAQAYCAYLGDLSTLCVEAESLEERCTGALRCGCCTTSREPDAHARMLMQSSLDVPAVLVQVHLVMRVHIIPPSKGLQPSAVCLCATGTDRMPLAPTQQSRVVVMQHFA